MAVRSAAGAAQNMGWSCSSMQTRQALEAAFKKFGRKHNDQSTTGCVEHSQQIVYSLQATHVAACRPRRPCEVPWTSSAAGTTIWLRASDS